MCAKHVSPTLCVLRADVSFLPRFPRHSPVWVERGLYLRHCNEKTSSLGRPHPVTKTLDSRLRGNDIGIKHNQLPSPLPIINPQVWRETRQQGVFVRRRITSDTSRIENSRTTKHHGQIAGFLRRENRRFHPPQKPTTTPRDSRKQAIISICAYGTYIRAASAGRIFSASMPNCTPYGLCSLTGKKGIPATPRCFAGKASSWRSTTCTSASSLRCCGAGSNTPPRSINVLRAAGPCKKRAWIR